jgi:hypothetical protein
VLVVGVGVAAGFAVGRETGETTTTTTLTQVQTTVARDETLPAAVDRTRRRILAAAEAHDWDALRRAIGGHALRYTFGPDVPGGAIAFWQRQERSGGRPLETLAAILKLPYTLSHGLYTWPFAYTVPPAELTPYEVKLLSSYATAKDVAAWKRFGGYYGYRAGIDPSGRWQFYVSGD